MTALLRERVTQGSRESDLILPEARGRVSRSHSRLVCSLIHSATGSAEQPSIAKFQCAFSGSACARLRALPSCAISTPFPRSRISATCSELI